MTFQFNWIDWIILGVGTYYLFEGWEVGLIYQVGNLISFLASLWLSIRYHFMVGAFLAEKFGVAKVWTTVMGYIVVAFVSEVIINEVFHVLIRRLPQKILASKTNQWLGSILSLANGLVIVAFFLLVVSVLPLRGTIKADVQSSTIGTVLLKVVDTYAGGVRKNLNETTKEALKFLTVQPRSQERIALDVTPKKSELSIDQQSEQEMLAFVNQERGKAGAPKLVLDERIAVVARAYSRDMFERRYFSHVSPEGKDAGDRLTAASIYYTYAGENLAYAPDVATAHQGLMNSEGHRRNILDPKFHKVGIGVIDGGINGRMFTQNFTD